jgi:hypothetical protein
MCLCGGFVQFAIIPAGRCMLHVPFRSRVFGIQTSARMFSVLLGREDWEEWSNYWAVGVCGKLNCQLGHWLSGGGKVGG